MQILTLCMSRFEFNTLFGGKINKAVHYPEYLDMRPFMSDKEACLTLIFLIFDIIFIVGSPGMV